MKSNNLRTASILMVLLMACGKDSPKPLPPILASVVTGTASAITSTEASFSGTVTSDGNATVTARGIVFSQSPGPTTASSVASAGAGTGDFVAMLTNLVPGVLYYVRAFATNSVGTAYGSEVTFQTMAILPTLTTKTVITITGTSAESGGEVLTDGGASVTARGICWSTIANPTIADSKTSDGSGTGAFSSMLTGLTPQTMYYVRAYATNSAGTAYGAQVSFTTTCVADLAGTVSYVTVVTAANNPITPCQPSVSGTTTFTMTTPGVFAIGDASFGEYDCAWADNPAAGISWVSNCNQLTVTGDDQYGLLWTYSIQSNNGTTLVIHWSSSYGDVGTSSLTRAGGWPLNLTF